MKQGIQHFPVNWVDGMKLNKNHFQQADAAVTDRFRDVYAQLLRQYEFGLLPPFQASAPGLELQVIDKKILLTSCRAVTANGSRIEIDQISLPELTASLDVLTRELPLKEGMIFYIILTVNPFKGIPTGEPNPEEIPPRLPSLLPAFSLSLAPADQLMAGQWAAYHLPVGRLIYQSAEFKQDTSYIPPCSRIDAYPALHQTYKELGKMLNSLEVNALKVVQKTGDEQRPGKINYLADSTHAFSVSLLNFLTQYATQYHLFLGQQSPIYLVEFFIRLAKTILVSWSSLKEKDREEMLSYFQQHANYSPSEWDIEIRSLIQLDYQHIDIQPALDRIREFMNKVDYLFSRLIGLKYVLRRIDEMVIGEGDAEKEKPPRTDRGFFLNR